MYRQTRSGAPIPAGFHVEDHDADLAYEWTCRQLDRIIAVSAQRYRHTWPDHCTTCEGWGGFTTEATCLEPPEFFPCEACLEKGLCPRCGESATQDSCPSCGWFFGVRGIEASW